MLASAAVREARCLTSVSAIFHHSPGQPQPRLFFQPRDLLGAAYLQLMQDAAQGAILRLCARPGCGEWFYYGPGTKHRETALYHSPRCQKAHAYLKTKGMAQ